MVLLKNENAMAAPIRSAGDPPLDARYKQEPLRTTAPASSARLSRPGISARKTADGALIMSGASACRAERSARRRLLECRIERRQAAKERAQAACQHVALGDL